MSIKNALSFIMQIGNNKELRLKCYQCKTKNELINILGFNENEFEDALDMQLIKCRSFEETEYINQIRHWFIMIQDI